MGEPARMVQLICKNGHVSSHPPERLGGRAAWCSVCGADLPYTPDEMASPDAGLHVVPADDPRASASVGGKRPVVGDRGGAKPEPDKGG